MSNGPIDRSDPSDKRFRGPTIILPMAKRDAKETSICSMIIPLFFPTIFFVFKNIIIILHAKQA
jgi:hypothetical protein